MLELALIADDLTGAADSGAQFRPCFQDLILIPQKELEGVLSAADFPSPQAIAVYTNSRALDPGIAAGRVKNLARTLRPYEPRIIYKKVDSCLRGNLGAEVEALLQEMGYDWSFIAPAFPEMGRTTFHDVHLVEGVPVAETEISRDPVTPVTESRLSVVLGRQTRLGVGHVDIEVLEGTKGVLGEEIQRWKTRGARHLVFDATKQEHLNKIAGVALSEGHRTLLVGSAGLAKGLRNHLPKGTTVQEKGPAFSNSGGGHLLVCGTASETARRQISVLTQAHRHEMITLPADLLAEPEMRCRLDQRASLAEQILKKSDLVVQIEAPGDFRSPDPMTDPSRAARIMEGLGVLMASISRLSRPGGLYLTGGDTASAVMNSLGAKGVRIRREIETGMVQGVLIGGAWDGLPVVTKAGAFGEDGILLALYESYRARAKRSKHGS